MSKIIQIAIIASLSLNTFSRDINESFERFDQYQRRRSLIKDDKSSKPVANGKEYQKANVFTVDTRDQETCHQIAGQLRDRNVISINDFSSFCILNEEKPLVSVVGFNDEVSQSEQTELSLKYSSLSDSHKKLATETRNFLVPATALMTLFFLMPEEHTGWEAFSFNELLEKYNGHISEGPVIDTNQWAYNWIGHPYSGAIYYTVARHAGLSKTSSFAYSFWMSALYWEYGVEAIAEVPSIQDLIITPVLGSLLGEAFMIAEQNIKNNGGLVLGSKFLGSASLFLVNPVEGMFNAIDNTFDGNFIQETEGYMRLSPGSNNTNLEFGIRLYF